MFFATYLECFAKICKIVVFFCNYLASQSSHNIRRLLKRHRDQFFRAMFLWIIWQISWLWNLQETFQKRIRNEYFQENMNDIWYFLIANLVVCENSTYLTTRKKKKIISMVIQFGEVVFPNLAGVFDLGSLKYTIPDHHCMVWASYGYKNGSDQIKINQLSSI